MSFEDHQLQAHAPINGDLSNKSLPSIQKVGYFEGFGELSKKEKNDKQYWLGNIMTDEEFEERVEEL